MYIHFLTVEIRDEFPEVLRRAVAGHEFVETDGVADGADFAFFLAVNGADGDGGNLESGAGGDEEHLGFVIECIGLAEERGGEVAVDHAEAALGIGDGLVADVADLP